jgi:hypothetical protein
LAISFYLSITQKFVTDKNAQHWKFKVQIHSTSLIFSYLLVNLLIYQFLSKKKTKNKG